MTRIINFSNPLLLGFDTMERTLERINKASEGYPPYNIERLYSEQKNDRLRITLAVAGFSNDDLDVSVEGNQLIIRGRQSDTQEHEYLHQGIAARQFQRVFMLADGMEVINALLKNGLLSIDVERPELEKRVQHIEIKANNEDIIHKFKENIGKRI